MQSQNDRMISVHFQGKPFNITVIQVYAPTSNVEEAEVERFYEDLQDLLELTPQKRCPFHYRGLECKSRKSVLGLRSSFTALHAVQVSVSQVNFFIATLYLHFPFIFWLSPILHTHTHTHTHISDAFYFLIT